MAADKTKANMASLMLRDMVDGKGTSSYGNSQTAMFARELAEQEFKNRNLWVSPVKVESNLTFGDDKISPKSYYDTAVDTKKAEKLKSKGVEAFSKEDARADIIDGLVAKGATRKEATDYVNRTFNY